MYLCLPAADLTYNVARSFSKFTRNNRYSRLPGYMQHVAYDLSEWCRGWKLTPVLGSKFVYWTTARGFRLHDLQSVDCSDAAVCLWLCCTKTRLKTSPACWRWTFQNFCSHFDGSILSIIPVCFILVSISLLGRIQSSVCMKESGHSGHDNLDERFCRFPRVTATSPVGAQGICSPSQLIWVDR